MVVVCVLNIQLKTTYLCFRRLDANLITDVPTQTFSGMRSLRHLWLDDNALTDIPVRALSDLSTLQAMTLALNRITDIPDYAFRNLSNLVVLYVNTSFVFPTPMAALLMSLNVEWNLNNMSSFQKLTKELTTFSVTLYREPNENKNKKAKGLYIVLKS